MAHHGRHASRLVCLAAVLVDAVASLQLVVPIFAASLTAGVILNSTAWIEVSYVEVMKHMLRY